MLGRRRRVVERASCAIDVAASFILLAAAYLLLSRFGQQWGDFLHWLTGYPFRINPVMHLEERPELFLILILFIFLSLWAGRFYQIDLFARWPAIVLGSLKGVGVGVLLAIAYFNFFSVIEFNRSLLYGFPLLFFAYQVTKEILFRKYLLDQYYHRRPLEALLVCPARDVGKRLDDFSQRHLASVVIKGVALVEGAPGDVAADLDPALPVEAVGGGSELAALLTRRRFDLVFLGQVRGHPEVADEVLATAEEQGVETWFFADFPTPVLARPEVDTYGGKPVVVFKTTTPREIELALKRLFDLGAAAGILLLLSPLILLIAALIKAGSRGPVFFVQERTGFRGKPFRMFKFRTMEAGAEGRRHELGEINEHEGPVFKADDDPRITPVGRLLRRYSLDELPQLINIVRGEMSLVGPRPLPVYETLQFEAFRDHRRYSVLPGLTGLWQVSGRNSIRDFSEWVRLDLEYIDSWSLWLDLVILFRTVPVVLSGQGAK